MPRQWYMLTPMVLCLGTASLRADLECAQPLVDKGEVRSGLSLRHRFTVVNQGSAAINIIEARPSCGCLSPKLDKCYLQPGESAELVLEINTLTQPDGINSWRVTMRYSDNGVECELPLYVRARVVAEISVEPPSLAIYTDRAISHEIIVIDRRVEPLMIRAVPVSSPYVRTKLGELSRDGAGRWRRVIHVEVLAECPEGRHEETLRICTSDPLYVELKVPFTIVKSARHAVNATPSAVVLSAPPGQPLPSRMVQLNAVDDSEVHIDSIESDGAAIECRWAQGPGTAASLKIRVDGQKIPGDRMRGIVHVHLSKPAKETIDIPVSCLLRS
ncbi:MAG: DUF1573 domain-containing protein, partial [Gemmataceae bacterium]